jgi:uncharacterized protein YjdB
MMSGSKGRRIVVAVVGAATAGACAREALQPERSPVAMVVVSPATATVAVGAQLPLTADVLDAAGNPVTGRRVHWAVEDLSIATVSADGRVTARKVGTVQVAASVEGKSGLALVTVNPIPVASVHLSQTSRSMLVGESFQLSAEPRDASGGPLPGRPITWTSNNPQVAVVNAGGLVTALAPGGAIITAAAEGKSAVAAITVAVVPVASVDVQPDSAGLVAGQTTQLQGHPRDSAGGVLRGRVVLWSTSSAQVATVTSTGVVTAIAPGRATITGASEGASGSAVITVNPRPVNAVILSPSQLNLAAGQTGQLTAQVTDDQGNSLSGRPVTYASNDAQVATVSSAGVVSGVAAGSAMITATSEGKSGTASVTVSPVPVSTVTVSPSQPNVVVGQTIRLTAEARSVSGLLLADRLVVWTTGAPGLATVSPAGVVTGAGPGTAIIFASIDGVLGSVTVTVRPIPVSSVIVTPSSATVSTGQSVSFRPTPLDMHGHALSGRVIAWSSSNALVASVAADGTVTGLLPGTATITATSSGTSGTAAVTVRLGAETAP